MPVVFNQSGQHVGRGVTVVSSSGGSVVIGSHGRVVVNGKVVSEGEPLPEVHQEFDDIHAVEIDGMEVTIRPGEKFKADGVGSVRKAGSVAIVSDEFEGELTVPAVDRLDVTVNSGSVNGTLNEAQTLRLKSNSGSIRLHVTNRQKPVNVEAKANSGDITINIQ